MTDNTIDIGFDVDTSQLDDSVSKSQDTLADHLNSIKQEYAEETAQLEILKAQYKESADAAIAERKRIEDARHDAIADALQKEAEKADATLALKEQLHAKELAETARHNAAIAALDLQAVKAHEAQWQAFMAPIKNAFQSSLQGLISGTETVHQALAKIGQAIVSDFSQVAAKRVTDWLMSELSMTEATTVGNTTRTASDQAAATASSGTSFTKALEEIEANAARVYSSVFAWAAPELGPFAAVPATAAAALVVAKEALVPSFDQGAWSLPGDMLAMVHQGETILPKPFAEDYRAAVSGGRTDAAGPRGDVHIHIHATDARSFERQLAGAGSALVKSLQQQARLFNPSLRPT